MSELQACGHHISLLIKSVESDYSFCELCECQSMKRDAEAMELQHQATITAQAAELEALRKDATRLNWIEDNLFERKWDGTIGRLCDWYIRGDYRHTTQTMKGNDFRSAIDAALQAKAALAILEAEQEWQSCGCDASSICPLGKRGSEPRCNIENFKERIEYIYCLIAGWREWDWPENFDRYTANLFEFYMNNKLRQPLPSPPSEGE
jgi:hypothetical protein